MGNGSQKGTPDVIGELVHEVRETFVKPLNAGLRDLLMVPGKHGPAEEPPPPKPPAPPRRPKPIGELKFEVQVSPARLGPVGSTVTILSTVTYRDTGADGIQRSWPYPAKWITTTFNGTDHEGPGPHTMKLDGIGKSSIVLKAIVDNGRTAKLTSIEVTSFCGTQIPEDPELKDLVCILFSEGGSDPRFSDLELRAIAWTLRNRHDALAEAQQANDLKKWKYFGGRWYKDPSGNPLPITTPLKYATMIRARQQFTGVDGPEWDKCKDPAKNVKTRLECERLAKCVQIINDVIVKGEPKDPYAGKGNPDRPGVFYYKKHGNTPPHKGPKLPPLTAKDLHYYQGLDPDFKP